MKLILKKTTKPDQAANGRQIFNFRKDKGVSQSELAAALDVSGPYLSLCERGLLPSYWTDARLAAAEKAVREIAGRRIVK